MHASFDVLLTKEKPETLRFSVDVQILRVVVREPFMLRPAWLE